MSKRLFGTIFVSLSWQQSEIWLNSAFVDFAPKNKYLSISMNMQMG